MARVSAAATGINCMDQFSQDRFPTAGTLYNANTVPSICWVGKNAASYKKTIQLIEDIPRYRATHLKYTYHICH